MTKQKGDKSSCPFGKASYPTKRAAEEASPRFKAKRCGRCRQWHPE